MSLDLANLKPYKDFIFIAEAGVNHENNVEEAIEMVEKAAIAGADIIKFQAYKADTLVSKDYAKAYWDTSEEEETSQYELFKKYETFSKEEWERIKNACDAKKIGFWLSIFDIKLFNELHGLCDGIKIASGDITHHRLIELALSTKKPVIVSTGGSTENEIEELESILQGKNAASLFCRLIYPTEDKDGYLQAFKKMQDKYISMKGISDHFKLGSGESVVLGYALGASIIEKHFTLDSSRVGNDHYHSITPKVLKAVMDQINRMKVLYGQDTIDEQPIRAEYPARRGARRSLYYFGDMAKGEKITEDSLVELRPDIGISAKLVKNYIGKIILRDVKRHEIAKDTDFQ